jgi:hypothetical protein
MSKATSFAELKQRNRSIKAQKKKERKEKSTGKGAKKAAAFGI